jgi:aryl-alcohol dehydrogenase-like predicted oxidoreductase
VAVELAPLAVGSWSGGRYMNFGVPVAEERLVRLLAPDPAIRTVVTADVYGQGAADELVGRALREGVGADVRIVAAVGHDFYSGSRAGAKGFPRFTDPALRRPDQYGSYLRMATERVLERLGVDRVDVLLLHNPDRTGYTSEVVWGELARLRDEGLCSALGVAPGPANGFTLDLISCFERFGDLVEWAMIILNPLEPWPGQLCLAAARAHGVRLIARVVDHGGLFWGDVRPGHPFPERDHRTFRPAGWVEAGLERIERMRPIAERHGLTPIQLAVSWVLAQEPVACAVPTLIQEPGPDARPIEEKRAELAATPLPVGLSAAEVAEIARIGDNRNCMPLKGASPDHEGPARADSWPLEPSDRDVARRWGIDPERDLAFAA